MPSVATRPSLPGTADSVAKVDSSRGCASELVSNTRWKLQLAPDPLPTACMASSFWTNRVSSRLSQPEWAPR